MKTLILILLLFSVTQIYSQDKNFITALTSAEVKKTDSLVTEIIEQAATEYKLVKIQNKRFKRIYYYLPSDIYKEGIQLSEHRKNAFVIEFFLQQQKDGSKTIKLNRIQAPYKDLFVSWKKYFKPTATIEELPSNFAMKNFKMDEFNFTFRKDSSFNSNVWRLLNKS